MQFAVLLSLLCCPVHGSLQLNSQNQVFNVQIGGLFPLMAFDPTDEIHFELDSTSSSSYSAGKFVYDTVYIGAESYSVLVEPVNYEQERTNRLTLGWYASYHAVITIMGSELFPFRHDKMLLGTGIKVGKGVGTGKIELPNKTVLTVEIQFLAQDGNQTVFLPMSIVPALDRTIEDVYAFPELELRIHTREAGNFYTLQLWNESFVGLGLAISSHGLATTFERESGRRVFGAYDESIVYSPENQLLIVFLSLVALVWYLFLINIDEAAYLANAERYDVRSILLSYAGTVLAVGTILRQILVYDLFTRMQYVTMTPLFEYTLLVASAFALVAFLHIYTTWDIHVVFELRRASIETVLALAIASIFVGRTEVCEETALCFVIACMWTPFQLMSIVRCSGWGRLILLLLFFIFYPLVAILLVEPLVATVPELATVTWPSSQLIMFLPPLLLLGLWTVVPSWSK